MKNLKGLLVVLFCLIAVGITAEDKTNVKELERKGHGSTTFRVFIDPESTYVLEFEQMKKNAFSSVSVYSDKWNPWDSFGITLNDVQKGECEIYNDDQEPIRIEIKVISGVDWQLKLIKQ